MSEFTATIDAYFEDAQQQEKLLDLLRNKKIIEIENENFSIQNCSVDEVVNFTLWAGGHDQTKLVTDWLSSFSPKFSIVECFSDESEKRLAFENGKKKSLKLVLNGFSLISKNYEAGLIFQGGVRKATAYLKSNDVDVLDVFQGERHIDRIFDRYDPDHDTKIFEILIEQGKITTDLVLNGSCPEADDGVVAAFCMNKGLVIKMLNNGGDANIIDHHSGKNLLCDFYFTPDQECLRELRSLLSLGVDVNHKDHHGRQPIEFFFNNLHQAVRGSESDEDIFLKQLKLLIEYGATPHFIDKHGFGCLFYAQGFDQISRFLNKNFVGLKVVEKPEEFEQLLLKYLSISDSRDNDARVLHKYIHYDLLNLLSVTEFRKFFINPKFLKEKAKVLRRIVEYLDEALILDSNDLLNVLCEVGVPITGVYTQSSYYWTEWKVPKIEETRNIKQRLEDENIFEKLNSSCRLKNEWGEKHINGQDDIDLLAKYCSDKLLEDIKRQYKEQGKRVPFGAYLSYNLEKIINQASRSWGEHIWIGSSSAVIEMPKNNFKIITLEEAFELPEFEVLSNALAP